MRLTQKTKCSARSPLVHFFSFFPLLIWHFQQELGWGERTTRGPGVALLVHSSQRCSSGVDDKTIQRDNSNRRRHSQRGAHGTQCHHVSRKTHHIVLRPNTHTRGYATKVAALSSLTAMGEDCTGVTRIAFRSTSFHRSLILRRPPGPGLRSTWPLVARTPLFFPYFRDVHTIFLSTVQAHNVDPDVQTRAGEDAEGIVGDCPLAQVLLAGEGGGPGVVLPTAAAFFPGSLAVTEHRVGASVAARRVVLHGQAV